MVAHDYKCLKCSSMREIDAPRGCHPLVEACSCGGEMIRHFVDQTKKATRMMTSARCMNGHEVAFESGEGEPKECHCGERFMTRMIASCAEGEIPNLRNSGTRSVPELVYDPKYTIPSMGRFAGRTDQQQHQLYKRMVNEAKKVDAQRRRSLARKKDTDDCQRIGKMPLEINEYITEMTGDPHAVSKDPVYWHKATGTWTGG